MCNVDVAVSCTCTLIDMLEVGWMLEKNILFCYRMAVVWTGWRKTDCSAIGWQLYGLVGEKQTVLLSGGS